MNTTLSQTLLTGLNNPECSFFVGATIGQYLVLKILGAIVIAYFVLRILETFIFTPLLNKLRIWAYKK